MDATALLRACELGSLSGVRPAWLLAALSAAAALGYLSLPPPLEPLGTWPSVGALLVLAVVERLTERDSDLSALVGSVQLGLSAAAALCSTEVLARSVGQVSPSWVRAAAVLFALATLGARRELKARLTTWARDLRSPVRWLARIEEGGLVCAGLLVVLAPFALAALWLGLALAAVGSGWLLASLEARNRVACAHCPARIRREAQRCPACRGAVEPALRLTLDVGAPRAQGDAR